MESKTILNGRYRINRTGEIFSCLTKKKLKSKITPVGYEYICLYPKKGLKKYFFIHVLVAEAYLGLKPKDFQVNHIDGDKLNNNLKNLEYVTQSENLLHAYRLGLKKGRKGSKHHNAKLNASKICEIFAYKHQGCRGSDIARFLDVSPSTICSVLKGTVWGHVDVGYLT